MNNYPPIDKDDRCPERIVEQLDDYIFNRLSEQDAAEVEYFYFNCDDCLEQLTLRREVKSLVANEAPALFPDYFASREEKQSAPAPASNVIEMPQSSTFHVRNLVYAAAATLLLFFGFKLFPLFSESEAPLSIEEYAARYGEAFAVSPNFESRLDDQLRGRVTNIDVVAPDNDAIIKEEIRFQWELPAGFDPEANRLSLHILNNFEETHYRANITSDSMRIKEKFEPGIYYWVIESAEETIYVGRFTVLPSS